MQFKLRLYQKVTNRVGVLSRKYRLSSGVRKIWEKIHVVTKYCTQLLSRWITSIKNWVWAGWREHRLADSHSLLSFSFRWHLRDMHAVLLIWLSNNYLPHYAELAYSKVPHVGAFRIQPGNMGPARNGDKSLSQFAWHHTVPKKHFYLNPNKFCWREVQRRM